MKHAVVDLGANTIRMSVYENGGGALHHVMSEKEVIGLISYTKDGILKEEGIERILSTLGEFCNTARDIGADTFRCFATAGLRNIRNAREVLRRVKNETGVEIHIISGEEEAALDFQGAYRASGLSAGLMADMGGGSTELVLFRGEQIVNAVSVPFGSLFLYKKFVKRIVPTASEEKKIRAFVRRELSAIEWLKGCAAGTAEVVSGTAGNLTGSSGDLCLIGGTSRAIARLHQEVYRRSGEPLQGYRFNARDIAGLHEKILKMGDTGLKLIARATPERLHTIFPGMLAFARIVRVSGASTVTLSRNGVREGYLQKYVLGGNGPGTGAG